MGQAVWSWRCSSTAESSQCWMERLPAQPGFVVTRDSLRQASWGEWELWIPCLKIT